MDNAYKVGQLRAINLRNISYKLISKILTDRLKPLLPKLISPYQLAFIPGRLIQDNFIVGAEIFHAMRHKQGKGSWISVKVDMEKAYDRAEWTFILKVLKLFGFHSKWLSWIKLCLTTSQFSILLNGVPFGNFSSSRGLRQGNPISPFLFLLCSEVLSRLLLKVEREG